MGFKKYKRIKSQKKTKFCAAVISNIYHTDNMRLDFINLLKLNKLFLILIFKVI